MRILACAGTKVPPATIGFRPESLDFRRGIRVGKLEEHERITPILKLALVLPGNSEPRASLLLLTSATSLLTQT